MTWIKICGLTNVEDALAASSLGTDALGFIFAPSQRRVTPALARDIIRRLSPPTFKVGVFVDEDIEIVRRIAGECHLDAVQLHGRETPEYCGQLPIPVIKAIRVKDAASLEAIPLYPSFSILLDAFNPGQAGGTGKTFCWEVARQARETRNFILSGGLYPGNVRQAIHLLRPWGVDVCSGVEKIPGQKDQTKMLNFIKEAKAADENPR
jgi:phosphoribosylanthranilate isomerase